MSPRAISTFVMTIDALWCLQLTNDKLKKRGEESIFIFSWLYSLLNNALKDLKFSNMHTLKLLFDFENWQSIHL